MGRPVGRRDPRAETGAQGDRVLCYHSARRSGPCTRSEVTRDLIPIHMTTSGKTWWQTASLERRPGR